MRQQGLWAANLILIAALSAIGGPACARRSTASVFKAVDTNSNGFIDSVEVRVAATALFERLDLDKDGTLDANELRGHLSEKDLKANDPGHDGKLTKDEYLAIVDQRFKDADVNHDGKIKINELTAPAGAALVRLITYQVEGEHPNPR
jgi:Ca2+-binding EF-hand superfamily protein